MTDLLSVRDLRVTYRHRGRRRRDVVAVAGVDLALGHGESIGLVGASGAGKSSVARALVHLVRADHGSIRVGEFEVTEFGRSAPRSFRRTAQIVFQNAAGSLNPGVSVGDIIGEPLALHVGLRGSARAQRAAALLEEVGLDPQLATRRRHELSVGQRQRVNIARSLAPDPRLLVLDEPVSALDAASKNGVISLLERLQAERRVAYLLITHDLAVATQLCTRIAVMHSGQIVEVGSVEQICDHPEHPYTRRLLDSILDLEPPPAGRPR
jgi:peptide/nickel transport system ATP-binding protein